jgi:hypothetical protein
MPNPVAKPKISQPWGKPNPRYSAKRHTGIDYAMPVGTPVLAVADGVISNVTTDKSYGEVVVLKADKYEIWYCHLSVKGVKKGQAVKVGQELGKSGNTGNSTGPHLHLETRQAPFRYGNDVSCPFIEDPATIHPDSPKERRVGLMQRMAAAVTTEKPTPTKSIIVSELTAKGKNESITIVQSALVDLVDSSLKVSGSWDAATVTAYKKWQTTLGYKGKDADGIPGTKSIAALGQKYGFTVK